MQLQGTLAEQCHRRLVHVVDTPIRLEGDDAVVHGIEGCERPRARSLERRRDRIRQHLHDREQQRGAPFVLDHDAREFGARDDAARAGQLDLEAVGGRFAREPALQVALEQLGIVRHDELAEAVADRVARVSADHVEEAGIGEHDAIVVDQHTLVHVLHQPA